MQLNYSIEEIHCRVFAIKFNNRYDCGMFFLRYQEFYESPNENFRGKSFEILDYMKWYVEEYKEFVFNYTERWAGYNFPGNIIKQVNCLGITDYNKYDTCMLTLYNDCIKKYPDNKFYIIGYTGEDTSTINHELAHSLFYLHENYTKCMSDCINKIKEKTKVKIFKILKSFGYTDSVLNDELQAYFATSDNSDLKKIFKLTKNQIKSANVFKLTFNEFLKEIPT